MYTIYVTQETADLPIRFVKSTLKTAVDAVANLVLLSLETEVTISTSIKVDDNDHNTILEIKL